MAEDRVPIDKAFIDAISKKLTDEGKLIEAGFMGFRSAFLTADASDAQIRLLRLAFMLGAQHLFASLMAVLDSDREPTEQDMRRMAMIDKELREFAQNSTHN